MPDLDFSHDSPAEFKMKLGELAQLSLQRSGAFVLLARGVREVTTLDPVILDQVSDDDMATALLDAWTEDEILTYLELRQKRRKERA
jgi:hypothetical protein